MTARVRGVMVSATRSASMLWVSGWMSTSTGVAPTAEMASAEAAKVWPP